MPTNKVLVFTAIAQDQSNPNKYFSMLFVYNAGTNTFDFYLNDQAANGAPGLATAIIPAGIAVTGSGGTGLAIGQAVAGSTPNQVLFVDGAGNLAEDAGLEFDETTGVFNAGDNTSALFIVDPTTGLINLLAGAAQDTGVLIDATDVQIAAPGGLASLGDLAGGGSVISVDSATDIISLVSSNPIFWTDNVRQTFNPGATAAGFNVGAVAADPTILVNGDLFYDSVLNQMKARINGATVALGAAVPGGSNTQVQFNNAGAFGGITGATSDATNVTFGSSNLRATSPRITTGLLDANGNSMVLFTAVGTAVNQLTITNSATGTPPTNNVILAATGTDGAVGLTISPKGTGRIILNGLVQIPTNGSATVPTLNLAGGASNTGFGDGSLTQAVTVFNNGVAKFAFYNNVNGFAIGNDRPITWFSSADVLTGAADTGIFRAAAGVLEVNNGTTGQGRSLTATRLVVPFNTTPHTLGLADNRKAYTNEGAAALNVINLPTAAANLDYSFIVQDADGIQIVAAAGDTIRIAAAVSSVAGTATSTTIGSALILTAINATEWVALSSVGVWILV